MKRADGKIDGAGEPNPERPITRYRKLKPGPGKAADAVAADQRSRIHRAMIELVAERGAERITVVEVTRLAGVSRRAFYRDFKGGDDCLVETYDLVVRCAARSILAAQPAGADWPERLAAGMAAFCETVDANPAAARLGLIEVLGLGPAAVHRMRYTFGLFGALLAERIESGGGSPRVAPVFVKAIAPGVSRVARVRLEEGGAPNLGRDAGELVEWVTAICGSRGVLPTAAHHPPTPEAAPREEDEEDGPPRPFVRVDERERILAAAESIAAKEGAAALTAAAIATAAGISRRRFKTRFESPSKALLAALDRRTAEVLDLIEAERERGENWPRGVHRAIAAVCGHWAEHPDGARMAFTEQLAVGVPGMQRRERVLDSVAERLALSANGASEVAATASLGAVWSLMFEAVIAGRAGSLPAIAPTLSFLLLAPVLGPHAATEEITVEVLEGYRGRPSSATPGTAA